METKSRRQLILRVLLTMVSQLGSSAFAMGLSLFIFQETNNALAFGVNTIITPIATLLLSPVLGTIIDRYSHKWIVINNQIFSLLLLLGYFLILSFDTSPSLAMTLGLVFLLKLADEFVLLALFASSITIVLEKDQQKLRSWQQVIANITGILSPILGVTLYSIFDFRHFVLWVFGTELLALIIVMMIDFQFIQSNDSNIIPIGEKITYRSLLSWFSHQKYLKSVVFLATVVSSIDTVIFISIPILILKILGLETIYYSLAMVAMVCGELLAGVILAQKTPAKSPLKNTYRLLGLSTLCLTVTGISVFVSNVMLVYLLVFLALFFMMFFESFYTIPLQVWYVAEIPEKVQGRIFSFISALISLFIPIATMIFGTAYELPIQNQKWLHAVIIIFAALLRLGILVYLRFIKKIQFKDAKVLPS